jgi:hypothetical protein
MRRYKRKDGFGGELGFVGLTSIGFTKRGVIFRPAETGLFFFFIMGDIFFICFLLSATCFLLETCFFICFLLSATCYLLRNFSKQKAGGRKLVAAALRAAVASKL